MIDNAQLSIFGDPGEENANAGDRIRSEGEVFEIARACLGHSAPVEDSGPAPAFIVRTRERRAQRAGEVGLVARWSKKFGFVSIHDPTTGEWHDVSWKVAPSWAKWEARKRKDLGRSGDGRAYDLPASGIREIWETENLPAEEEGIVEEHPVEGEG
ncbi:MAG: hypothetical protein M3Q49_03685 [Actinomycetota bacterium]|nr:hypothetical protein [Actinomycetota bacterium]